MTDGPRAGVLEAPGFESDPRRSGTLPARFNHDPPIHRLELERIFAREWIYVCHGSQVREPGMYAAHPVGEHEVFVIRAADGGLRGLFNLCTHLPHTLLERVGRTETHRLSLLGAALQSRGLPSEGARCRER